MAKQEATLDRPTFVHPTPNIDDHKADLARRQAEHDAHSSVLLDCLDPTVAKRYQDAKPLYEWRVQLRIFRAAQGRVAAHMEDFDKQVVAHDEQDAWSYFCDLIEEWPSPRSAARNLKITRLKKRTLHGDSDEA